MGQHTRGRLALHLKYVVDHFKLTYGCLLSSIMNNAASNFPKPCELQSTLEALGITWPILRNHISRMAQVIQRVLPKVQNLRIGSVSGSDPELNCCNGYYHTNTRTVAIGPVFPPKTQHFNLTTLPPVKYLSSVCIVI